MSIIALILTAIIMFIFRQFYLNIDDDISILNNSVIYYAFQVAIEEFLKYFFIYFFLKNRNGFFYIIIFIIMEKLSYLIPGGIDGFFNILFFVLGSFVHLFSFILYRLSGSFSLKTYIICFIPHYIANVSSHYKDEILFLNYTYALTILILIFLTIKYTIENKDILFRK